MSSQNKEKRRSSSKKKQKKKDCFLQSWGQLQSLANCPYEIFNIDLQGQAIYNVFAGENHSFFFTMKNDLLGFGDNSFHQLSPQETDQSPVNNYKGGQVFISPKKLHMNLKIEISKLICGSGFTYCIDNSQNVYSWGLNNKGQLGHGHQNNLNEPTLIRSLLPPNKQYEGIMNSEGTETSEPDDGKSGELDSLMHKFSLYKDEIVTDIACGGSHVIISTSKKRILSCGYGSSGALGHEDIKEIESSFREIETLTKYITKNYIQEVNDLELQIKCGVSHSCCLIYNRLFIWGVFGDLEVDQYSIIPTELNIKFEISDFECGNLITVFLSTTGEVYTIGNWKMACLGISKDKIEKYFMSLMNERKGKILQSSKSQSVFNRKKSFSKNKQMKMNLKKELFTPIEVKLSVKINQIAIGNNHIYALNQHLGVIYGWGNNEWGQLIPNCKDNLVWKPRSLSFLNGCGSFVILCRGNNSFLISRKIITGTTQLKQISINENLNKCKQNYMKETDTILTVQKQIKNLEKEKNELKEILKEKNKELEMMRMTRREEEFVGESAVSFEPNESDYKWEINKIIKSFKKELSEDRTLKPHCEIDFAELEIESQISEGGFGLIFKAKWRESTVAVKVMKQELMKKELIKDFLSKFN